MLNYEGESYVCEITREEFKTLKDAVEQNNRTLRGGNGNTGLCTTVELVQNDVSWIRRQMEDNQKNTITWRWLFDKLASPIIVGVIVGVIMLLAN